MKNFCLFVGVATFSLSLASHAPQAIPVARGEPLIYQKGVASWYGPGFHGRQTANGEIYNMYALTAAHKTLPLGTRVRIRSFDTGKTVDVRINDRGPYVDGRVIDLSLRAAQKLGITEQGLDRVEVRILSLGQNRRAKTKAVILAKSTFINKKN